jgi:hypothetical protein
VDQPVGAALNRDLSEAVNYERVERAETELDAFISRRVQQERRIQAEREPWVESARRYNAERQRQLAIEWREFHYLMADRCRNNLIDMISYHEREAEKYDRLIPSEAEQQGGA